MIKGGIAGIIRKYKDQEKIIIHIINRLNIFQYQQQTHILYYRQTLLLIVNIIKYIFFSLKEITYG